MKKTYQIEVKQFMFNQKDLQRQLAKEGATLQALLDQVRERYAKNY